VTKLLSNGQEPGGTEINARDAHGFTAAFWAGMLGHLDTLKVLVKEGADITIASKSGLTMLMAAAYWGKSDVTEYLLDSGLHPDQHDRAGWNACMWAAAKSSGARFSTGLHSRMPLSFAPLLRLK
jgi:ankyrin repeat protein